jgi:hypothetical protein
VKIGLWGFGFLAVVASAAFSAPAQAAEASFGGQVSYGFGLSDDDGDAQLGIGGRVVLDLSDQKAGVEAIGSFDYFFPEEVLGVDLSYWEINANLVYNLSPMGSLRPYVGAGLNLAHASAEGFDGETDAGLNVLGGLKLSRHVFVEARVELGGGEQAVLSAGYRF